MAISANRIKQWLETVGDAWVAINDGGLALVVVGEEEIYLEAGGVPEEE